MKTKSEAYLNIERLSVFIPAHIPYPGLEISMKRFISLIKSLSRDDSLAWIARLNLILSNPINNNMFAKQEYCIQLLGLPYPVISRINLFYTSRRKHNNSDPIVFFRGQLLELVRWIVRYSNNFPDDGTTFEKYSNRRAFSQAAFIASEFWQRRVYKRLNSGEYEITEQRHQEQSEIRQAIQATGYTSHIGFILSRIYHLYIQIYFDLNEPDGLSTSKKFLNKTGVTPLQFFECATLVYLHCVLISPEDTINGKFGIFSIDLLCENCLDIKPELERFINLVSQTPEELKARIWEQNTVKTLNATCAYNYSPFLKYPILRFHDGRAIVLDSHLYMDSVLDGSIFFSRIDRSEIPLARFGYCFEKYCRHLLSPQASSRSKSQFLPTAYNTINKDCELEADAVFLCGKSCILFEIKHAFIRENEDDIDSSKFIEILEQKYGHGKKVKGYGQLGRLIRKSIEGLWKPNVDAYKPQEFYPVLVVSDKYITSSLTLKYLADRFDLEFPGATISNNTIYYQNHTIHRLIVLDVEEVERLGRIIDDGQLLNLLREYSINNSLRMNSLTQHVFSTQKWKLKPRDSFLDNGINWIEQLAKKLFHKSAD